MSSRTLRGITWDHPRGHECLVRCAAVYQKTHDIEVQWTARSLKDFGDAPLEQFAAGADLLVIDHPHVGWAQTTGALLPLDTLLAREQIERLRAQSAGAAHPSYDFGGHQWAVAVDISMQAAAYRPDLLDAPVPRNWDAVLDLARHLRGQGRWLAVPLAPTDAICLFISLCAGAGDQPGRRDDGRFVSPALGREALRRLRALATLMLPEALDWNPIQLLDAMATRSDIAYCPATFIYSNYARTGFRTHGLRYADIPGVRGSCLGGAGIAVSARSANARAAAEFAFWVSEAAVQRTIYVEAQGQPGNVAAWEDEAANALTHNFFVDTRATLDTAYVRPRHSRWPNFQENAGNRIHQWLRTESSGGEDGLLASLDDLQAPATQA